jgi:hypothetical protein
MSNNDALKSNLEPDISAGERETPKEKSLKLSGQVFGPDEEGVREALVEIMETGVKTYTDREGKYLFDVIPSGRYTLRVIATGFKRQMQVVDLIKQLKDCSLTLDKI